ncbi:haloacid dehalogenase [Klenkia taihuensis]|uniref:2-haloacid dehalogenase n=1 Tax=Klenkia taihuensis TaxID=1225127 RepID=A0A1I1QV25_9ACTN|nr:haloacid dehalogenase [Klenkia taihuensis]GHE07444.1 haloacid dehalogenase [Klenkia taihuensis]SFD25852.1 2-haloacid dehalogenase [Klenkia taihuensis]
MFVTIDLFSALVDSRSGAAPVLAALAADQGHDADGGELYDDWDARNKATQRDRTDWVPFAEHCRQALVATWAARGWDAGDAPAAALLGSLPDWPLWPDVADALPGVRAAGHRVGVLSNVDDDLLARTRVAPLVDDADRLTSERLRAYKPSPALYRRAVDAGVDVHVPASARDTRGALEAGIAVVRVARPGHRTDPAGPQPAHTVTDLHALPGVLDRLG